MENRIQRGEVYFIFLDPAFGREIGGYKTRPSVVVSIDDIHQNTRIVAVVPGTTTFSSGPNIARVDGDNRNGLRETTYFACHQIRAVDQGRMTARPIGRLSSQAFDRVLTALRHGLGFPELP